MPVWQNPDFFFIHFQFSVINVFCISAYHFFVMNMLIS